MNQNPNMAGLAGLLASKGRDGDSVLVHMTPGEVEGLQAIALAAGGSLTTNPNTGLPEANFLKSILPAIAGSTLKALFPNLGSAATGLIVGGLSGLVDKSFDKGMRSGLSAYSGAKTIEGLQAAREAVRPIATPRIVSGEDELSSERLRDARTPIDLSKIRVETPQVQTVTKAPSLFGEGVRALFKPEGQEAFLQSVEGPYKRQGLRDLSRSAYFAGLANIAAREPKKLRPGSGSSNARFYVPGEVNPLYGQGYDQWYFKPGYFSDKYPGYAAGGEVMVSPDAVLPQTLSVSQPAFTQDREGLKDYYESLLSPPGPPRDISELNAYLDDLRNRLRRPYQPVSSSDWQYGELPTGGGGGGGGGTSPTPDGTDPYATGVTGTPADLIKPPAPPAPPPPPAPVESLTPPTNIGTPATPSDLGFLFGTPGEFPTEPPDEKEPGIVIIAEPGTTAEDYTGEIGSISGPPGAGGLPPIVSEPEQETATSVEVFDPANIASDYIGIPVSVGTSGAGGLPPIVSEPEPEQETATSIEAFDPANIASDYIGIPVSVGTPGAGGLPPIVSDRPIYSVAVTPENEQSASDEFRQQLYNDLGGVGAVPGVGFELPLDMFTSPMNVSDIGDLSKPIVDQILRDFDAQQAAQPKEQTLFSRFLDLVESTGGVTGAVVSAFREAVTQFKEGDLNAKKLIEEAAKGAFGEELVEEALKALAPKDEPKEEAKEAEEDVFAQPETEPTTLAPSGGGSAIPWTSYQNYTLRDLINPVEDSGGTPTVTVEEMGMAGGGAVPRFAQGGLGSLQQYAVGGKLVNGAGDGMSDDIKANINGTQEARLADGEFVIPADVVSHLGNGSTDAGAKQLYAMMDRIRKVRTGRNKQAPEVNVRKHMPA